MDRVKTLINKGFRDFEPHYLFVLHSVICVTETDIHYLPCEEIVTEESELRETLYIFGQYDFSTPEELDTLCEFVDKLNELGYQHRIAITDTSTSKRSIAGNNNTSDEIREFFESD